MQDSSPNHTQMSFMVGSSIPKHMENVSDEVIVRHCEKATKRWWGSGLENGQVLSQWLAILNRIIV